MQKKDEMGKRVLFFAGIVGGLYLLSICFLMFLTGGVMFYDAVKQNLTWREDTKPLTEETIVDLCTIFSISPDDPRCSNSGKDIYAPDFFVEVYETFTPKEGARATFEDVDAMIGEYEYKCEPTVEQGDGTKYFICAYDFVGDRVFPVVVFFYADGRIMRLVANVSD